MTPKRALVWSVGCVAVLAVLVAGVLFREKVIAREIRQAHAEYSEALSKFDKEGTAPVGFDRLPWSTQYTYLKQNVYPKKQRHLDRAKAELATIKRLAGNTWNWKLRPGLERYEAAESELLRVYEELWANEKAIDKEYYALNWKERQRLALARRPLLDRLVPLREEARKRWEATGL